MDYDKRAFALNFIPVIVILAIYFPFFLIHIILFIVEIIFSIFQIKFRTKKLIEKNSLNYTQTMNKQRQKELKISIFTLLPLFKQVLKAFLRWIMINEALR